MCLGGGCGGAPSMWGRPLAARVSLAVGCGRRVMLSPPARGAAK